MPIERGQIDFVVLDPVFGREMGGFKSRPVVVVPINILNQKGLPVTVVPGTSDKGKPLAFRNIVAVNPTPQNGLTSPTNFECHQVRAIDQGRFTQRPIGVMAPTDLRRVEEAIKHNLGLSI